MLCIKTLDFLYKIFEQELDEIQKCVPDRRSSYQQGWIDAYGSILDDLKSKMKSTVEINYIYASVPTWIMLEPQCPIPGE